MKSLKYITILVFLVFTACKTTKQVAAITTIKKMSAKRIAKKHTLAHFNKNTVAAKLGVQYKDAKEQHRFSVKLRMLKDSIIWLKGTKLITVFKAKITPSTFSYYSPLEKRYFEGSFDMLEKLLGTKINFNQLQNLLLGEAVYNLKAQKYLATIIEKAYVLTPKKQSKLFHLNFKVNPQHYKLDAQSISSISEKKALQVVYKSYVKKEGALFPKKVHLKATQNNNFTHLFMDVKQIDFNENLDFSYRVPGGYKRIEVQ